MKEFFYNFIVYDITPHFVEDDIGLVDSIRVRGPGGLGLSDRVSTVPPSTRPPLSTTNQPNVKKENEVRTEFPETFLWDLKIVS